MESELVGGSEASEAGREGDADDDYSVMDPPPSPAGKDLHAQLRPSPGSESKHVDTTRRDDENLGVLQTESTHAGEMEIDDDGESLRIVWPTLHRPQVTTKPEVSYTITSQAPPADSAANGPSLDRSDASYARLPVPGERFKQPDSFFAACRDGLMSTMGTVMHRLSIGNSTIASACGMRKSHGCPFRIRALREKGGDYVVSNERSFWTHKHEDDDDEASSLSEPEGVITPVVQPRRTAVASAHQQPVEPPTSTVRLPVPGDTFESTKSFYAACCESLMNEMGVGMSYTRPTSSTITTTCLRRSRNGCRFLIRAVIDSAGRWVLQAPLTRSSPLFVFPTFLLRRPVS
ncbi:hypothetical protein RQP46_010484 [Phenoliferia psychrophenolica]